MGRIRGHYEWDDDDLTPGQKREGGLHQNLFDQEGKLKGSARFVPDDGNDEPVIVTETVFVTVADRRGNEEQAELQEAIASLVVVLLGEGVKRGWPLVERWWQETGSPGLRATRERFAKRRARTRLNVAPKSPSPTPTQELVEAPAYTQPRMSRSEAQARLLAALAARAYSDEQVRLVANADIIETEGIDGVERSLAKLPLEQVRALIEAMAADPAMLSDESLASLASILARAHGSLAPPPGSSNRRGTGLSRRNERPPRRKSSQPNTRE